MVWEHLAQITHTAKLDLKNLHISRSTSSLPFLLISPAPWKHWFLEFGYLVLDSLIFISLTIVRNEIAADSIVSSQIHKGQCDFLLLLGGKMFPSHCDHYPSIYLLCCLWHCIDCAQWGRLCFDHDPDQRIPAIAFNIAWPCGWPMHPAV